MADRTPWKSKRQPSQGDRPPIYSSLGGTLNQSPKPKHSTPRSLSGVLNQGEKPMAPTSVKKLGSILNQGK